MSITAQTYLGPAPLFMIASGLILWGWQTDHLALSIVMAIVLESSHFIKFKLELDNRDFNRISDYTSLVMVITILYMFYNYGAPGIFEILASLPMLLFPLILAQLYSTLGILNSSCLFVSLRKLKGDDPYFIDNRIDLGIPYFIICVISASEGNQHPDFFFLIICILIAWVLWNFRSQRYHPSIWILMLAIATGTAFTTQKGLKYLQGQLEANYIEFFNRFHSANRDANRQTTAIGSIGLLKLSDRIVLRVEPGHRLTQPLHLAEASYNYYAYGTWTNINRESVVIDPEINGSSWLLKRPDDGQSQALITAYHKEDEAILPVPQGITGIHELSAFQLERANSDSIKAEIKPGWNSWKVHYNPDSITSVDPVSGDLHIGQTYRDDLYQLANELGLYGKPDIETVNIIKRFFQENFRYSLIQKRRYPRGRYLSKFLFEDRKGHCEYFATATTLLLRTIGIPARYVVGYAVDEYSAFEGKYIARSRHAHSWVMAYVDDKWIKIDTTPSIWADLESENKSSFQFMGDLWSWMRLMTNKQANSQFFRQLDATWVITGLFIVLVMMICIRKKKQPRTIAEKAEKAKIEISGQDSPLFEYMRALEAFGYHRNPGETLQEWFNRLSEKIPGLNNYEVIKKHNEYRFNPGTDVKPGDIEILIKSVLPEPDAVENQRLPLDV